VELRTESVFDALKQPLALVESDERRRAIEAYIEAARVPLERAVHDLLSELARTVDARVGDHYRIRLAYSPEGLTVEVDERVQQQGEETGWATMEGDVEKITIRIPAELKDLATQAAARAGTSANTWFIKALARALRNFDAETPRAWHEARREARGERHGRGGRLSGWVGGDE